MNIFFHPYSLIPKRSSNANNSAIKEKIGVLLCIDGGYSTLQPSNEFGDASLEQQLRLLSDGRKNALIDRSLYYSGLDKDAREQGLSLSISNCPVSHRLISSVEDLANANGEGPPLKLKIRNDLAQVINGLNDTQLSRRLRLDANSCLSFQEAKDFWQQLSPETKAKIDFVEDPCPYDEPHWNSLESFGMNIAYDGYGGKEIGGGYRIRVLKPLLQNVSELALKEKKAGRSICVTSLLDHPLGQVIAAYEGSCLHKDHGDLISSSGVLSHLVYEPNEFSECLSTGSDGRLSIQEGTGFGFDDLLKRLPWKKLS